MAHANPFFSESECRHLDEARRNVDPSTATIVYCVYENPFAVSGGIFAVARHYSKALVTGGRNAIVLSPFHSKLKSGPKEALKCLGSCVVPFGSDRIDVDVLEHRVGDVRWILFRAKGFFEASGGMGGVDPYVHEDADALLTDSLFASAAIPHVLAKLKMDSNLIVHVQDWELAATALTVKLALLDQRLKSAAVVLTSHNPYDRDLSSQDLARLTTRDYLGSSAPTTVYQYFMPLVDAPVTTVSDVFAKDLTSDPLQTEYFADHLQAIFSDRNVIGVDNGLFLSAKSPFSENAIAEATAGRPSSILAEKEKFRTAMLGELEAYEDERIYGGLTGHDGGALSDLPADIPVFMMFGRLDPGQKGFDVLARAIEALPPGRCRFVLTPIVPNETAFSDDLKQLADRRAGDVAVYPFRMQQGYMEAMAGATFAVLPSLYEPFGAATEPYLMGTPVIGRATGGLCQQVADWHADPDNATGFTYRETPPDKSTVAADWKTIQRAKTPLARFSSPLYGAMVASLAATLASAAELYRCDKDSYGKMLANLFEKSHAFSWERAMSEYQRVYEMAAK
jgi:glycogen synthase